MTRKFMTDCALCRGLGHVRFWDGWRWMQAECTHCNGSGKIIYETRVSDTTKLIEVTDDEN